MIWEKTIPYGYPVSDFLADIEQTVDGGYIVTNITSDNGGYTDFQFIKLYCENIPEGECDCYGNV